MSNDIQQQREAFADHFREYLRLYGREAFDDGSADPKTMAAAYADVGETGELSLEGATLVIEQILEHGHLLS